MVTPRLGRVSRLVVPGFLAVLLFVPSLAVATANGHLQLHFMNVGQGDGALLLTPGGQSVLIDNGVLNRCDRPVAYLQGLGLSAIDYHIASHYHADHIGCTQEDRERLSLACRLRPLLQFAERLLLSPDWNFLAKQDVRRTIDRAEELFIAVATRRGDREIAL